MEQTSGWAIEQDKPLQQRVERAQRLHERYHELYAVLVIWESLPAEGMLRRSCAPAHE